MGQLAVPAEQLGSGAASSTEQLPKVLRDILTKARTSWLRNQEVVDLLTNYRTYRFRVSKEPPQKPPGVWNHLRVHLFKPCSREVGIRGNTQSVLWTCGAVIIQYLHLFGLQGFRV